MKNNYIVKSIIFIIILFLGINIKTTAQILNNCPAGYTQIVTDVSVTENDITCVYQVFLCTKCQAGTYPGSILTDIMVHAVRPMDENCQCNPTVVMNAIIDKINDVTWLAQFISNCGNGWPPCDYDPNPPDIAPIKIDYYYPKCWKWNYFIINEDPLEYIQMKVSGCDCF